MPVVADAREGVFLIGQDRACLWDEPCLSVAGDGEALVCFAERKAMIFDGSAPRAFAPPPHVTRAALLPQALLALSEDGDGVYQLDRRTGAPRYFSPAGCFPRDMAVSPGGRLLAVAGGAGGRVIVLESAALRQIQEYHFYGTAAAVCFCGAALFALIRKENEERSVLVRCGGEALCAVEGAPCALCGFGKGLLVLTADRAYQTDLSGARLRSWPCGLPVRALNAQNGAYVLNAQNACLTFCPLLGRARIVARLNEPTDIAECDERAAAWIRPCDK